MRPIYIFELPSEVLEHISSYLSPKDVMKMRVVSRLFLDLISNSHYLQHRLDLFSAGLVDNPHFVCSLAERRARLRDYEDGWKKPDVSCQQVHSLKAQAMPIPIGQNLFSAIPRGKAICFICVPPLLGQEMANEWTLELPFNFFHYAVWSQDNLFAVVEIGVIMEEGQEFINVHLLNLLDGSPHEIPLKRVLTLDFEHYQHLSVKNVEISGSRIALIIGATSSPVARGRHWELVVWDWKTGEVVLRRSVADPDIGELISNIAALCFLEGFLLFALSDAGPIMVFNTLLPQQDPRSWGVFDLPLPPDPPGRYSICTRYEKPQAEFPEFAVDPAQRIFAVFSPPDLALVFPVGLFMRYMDSVRTNHYVSWDEWGGETTTIRLSPDTLQLQIFNTKILALRNESPSLGQWGVEMFDLSVSGRRGIGEGAGRGCNRVLSKSKWSVLCPRGDQPSYNTVIVGNSVCFSVLPYSALHRVGTIRLARTCNPHLQIWANVNGDLKT